MNARDKSASGRFVLRTGRALHAALRRWAEKAGVSLNHACVALLEQGISQRHHAKKDRGEHQEVVGEILRAFEGKVEAIVLFGSAARGESWQDGASDLDLLLVLRRGEKVTRALYSRWDQEMEALKDQRVSPQFVQYPEDRDRVGSIWLEVAIDGRVLWDPAGEVSRILRMLRHEILSGSWRRRTLHGQGYWIREGE